jgi:hypothetical protein
MNTFLTETLPALHPSIGWMESSILRTLLYFDIFHHPLKAEEIRQYLRDDEVEEEHFHETLRSLQHRRLIWSGHDYYAVRQVEELARRRMDGETRAGKAMKTARKYAAIMASFPFVRGVCISGSLSKGTMEPEADIDYFIITHPGRLWLARTLLVGFKKIFLLNSRKYFCVNYFITGDNLTIPDQNIFTATEAVTLIPLYNTDLYESFLRSNEWIRTYFPKFTRNNGEGCIREKKYRMKKRWEAVLDGRLGKKLDSFCLYITLKFWKHKFSELDASTFEHRLRSRKNVSKHHPQGFQDKVLQAYESRIQKFEDQHALSLS